MIRDKNILRVCEVSWEHLWTRRQRFSLMLAQNNNRVIYVEPAGSLLDFLIYPGRKIKILLRPKIRKIDNIELFILTPSMRIPLAGTFSKLGINWVNNYNQKKLLRNIVWATKKVNFSCDILWLYFQKSLSINLLEYFQSATLVYDCVDAVHKHKNTNIKSIELERKILNKADVVFSTSIKLKNYLDQYNNNVHYFSNGVDLELYGKALDNETIIPIELKETNKLIIGYVGVTYNLIRMDILDYLLEQRPDWHIVMIGPIHIDISKYKKYNNITFLGVKKKEEIPNYLKSFAVCLNLFVKNDFTNNINPLKVYEYLAAGKPVVSVTMPELNKFKDVIYFADDKETFLHQVEFAINSNNAKLVNQRISAVAQYSWDKIFSEINKTIMKKIK